MGCISFFALLIFFPYIISAGETDHNITGTDVLIESFQQTIFSSGENENIELIGRWPYGPCQTVTIEGSTAYISNGALLEIIDISNPSSFQILGKVILPEPAKKINITGNYAYVADGESGLRIIDISSPGYSFEVGCYEMDNEAICLDVFEDYAYVGGSELRVIDISDPSNPFQVGNLSVVCYDAAIAPSGNYAYIASKNPGFRIINVSDPTDPYESGNFNIDYGDGVDISDSYAYVVSRNSRLLLAINISNPASPFEADSYHIEGDARDITISDNTAYVADRIGLKGLWIFDISIPENIVEVGSYDSSNPVYCVGICGDYAHMSEGDGLRVLDISDPENPSEENFYNTPGSSRDVEVNGQYAYIACLNEGLRIINIIDPENPFESGWCTTPGSSRDVEVAGNYAYIASSSDGLRIINVSSPSNPNEVSYYPSSNSTVAVDISGNYAYLAEHSGGLNVVDISDPLNPIEVGSYNTGGYAKDVVVHNGYAYVADDNAGLRIIDVTNPQSLFEKGFYITDAEGIAVDSNYAYIEGLSGLSILDISDPANPFEIGFFDTPENVRDVSISNGFAYVADWSAGLRVVNISYPENPFEVGYYNTGSVAMGVTVSDQYVYLADEYDGLYILSGCSLVNIENPTKNDILSVGENYEIIWSKQCVPDSISIFLSIDSGDNYSEPIAIGLSGTSTSYRWNVPNFPVETARLKVITYNAGSISGFDESDGDFTIQGLPRKYVSSTGSNSYPYSLPRWAAHDIQDALDAAVDGDTVMVAGDSYTGSLYSTTAAYIMGGWNNDFTVNNPSIYSTSIAGSGSLIMFTHASGVCGIEGFQLTGGHGTPQNDPISGSYGGGILCQLVNYAIIKDNNFNSCGYTSTSNYSGGGAIACLYSDSALISGNTINASEAQSGGAIYLHHTDGTVTGNRITGSFPDVSYSGGKNGGGIYAYHSALNLSGNYIGGNTGYADGGGIYAHFSPITLSGDSLVNNSCSSDGGGIYSQYGSMAASGCVVTGNSSSFMGGGVYFKSENCELFNSLIAENEAVVFGGGFYADSVSGALNNNTFDHNTTSNGGGNVWVMTPITGLEFMNNLVTYGSTNGAHFNSTDNLTFQYNNCYGNSPSDVSSHTPDTTNISMDPYYADTTAMDYQLALHSASIDAGDPSGGNDPDGSRVDQGMYGGPGATTSRPDYVQNISASAVNDTTIQVSWDELSGDVDSYAVYAGAGSGFKPGESYYLGSVAAGSSSYQHYPVDTCWYYRINGVSASGYAGGYSAEAAECASGADLIPPAVEVIYPNGGEIFSVGDTLEIEWIATDGSGVDSLSISYSTDAGGDYTLITSGEPNDSLYQWTVPATLSDSCLIRITAFDPTLNIGSDISDSLFAIQQNTGVEDEWEEEDGMPRLVNHLSQNRPNPFNGTTTIAYSVKERSYVELKIYDTMGRVVKVLETGIKAPGTHEVIWNGRNRENRAVTSGVYFCRMRIDKFSRTRKIIYLR